MAEAVAELAPQARKILAEREIERRRCEAHPAELLKHVSCVDATDGSVFKFQLINPEDDWYWQRELLDEWLAGSKHICLKARQLGITWLAAALALWTLLYKPGAGVLIVSTKEGEAIKVANRLWNMLKSLPQWLWNGAEVIKPQRSEPTSDIWLKFPDGRISKLEALASTPAAGHGSTAALVILDEFSRQDYARESWKAAVPTTQAAKKTGKQPGRVLVISTGNGVSKAGAGTDFRGGNFFHHLWVNAREYGLTKRFLAWDQHPDRDEDWYRLNAESLPPADRGEQYPRDPDEAFILTGSPYFEGEAIAYYMKLIPEPLFAFDFDAEGRKAKFRKWEQGRIGVYSPPDETHKYAIFADPATGRGEDYSAAYVIDLAEPRLCAEFRGKLDQDLFAEQLHFLGRWYNTALIAVEVAGGFGEAVTISLRDGKSARPPYPNLYKHRFSNRQGFQEAKTIGFPTNIHTRPLILTQLRKAIRERTLPFMTQQLWDECRTFVNRETGTTPRAQDGCNDDCVMACAGALEMYRLFGEHPERPKRKTKRKPLYQPIAA
ncbi:MAG: hypothetical protein WC565_03030 [Parcubacteria group bacterium]